ncbi:phosphonate C-P lyase system protein PhnG [Ornithinibacillus sp. L9]|uniref:Phosphonate C-P lyase system protein PhnG n=2 Tax=Ornithinibacillus caprae TaxID=2678566 RepID=A0A6N8FRD0_9BACI|nr:phosphonate C-P lyase system protein PhnG [Ornithinibacillus caprae]MUK90328.1 phosphonate C-P lyase system protein PhnG [Ornithinibacillus caprae]
MNRRRRTEILIQGNSDLAREFAEHIMEHYPYREVMSPRYGLTMIKMRETAKNSLFHLGEVLVTEAKVEIKQQIGIGIVIGMKEELAKHLAIIDSAFKANLKETKEWEERLLEEEESILTEKIKKQTELLETRVQFETMDM